MKLPNADRALIPDAKLTHYLLDEEHPVGGAKARFFKQLGFAVERPEQLRDALLEVARSGEAHEISSRFGTKYVVDGDLRSHSGERTARVRTIWLIEPGHDVPRFVTAYPA